MRIKSIGSVNGYIPRIPYSGYAEILRLERMEAREKEHRKQMQQLYCRKTNSMAMDMRDIVPFYTKDGTAGHYEYTIFDEYA